MPVVTVFSTGPLDAMDEYGGVLYGIGRGQLFRSTDGGKSWAERNRQFRIEALDLLVLDEKNWLVGNWDGLFRSEDGGMSWAQLSPSSVYSVQRILRYQDRILIAAESLQNRRLAGDFLFESRDQGRTWTKGGKLPHDTRDLCTNSDQTTLYATDGTVWHNSADDGQSWTPLSTPEFEIPAGAVCRPGRTGNSGDQLPEVRLPGEFLSIVSSLTTLKDGTLLHADEGNRLFRRLPNGNWDRTFLPQPVRNGNGRFRPSQGRALTANGSEIYVSGGGHLLRSADGGKTWARIPPPAENVLFLATAALSGSGRLLVATVRETATALYYETLTTDDAGRSWSVMTDTNCVTLWGSGETVVCLDAAPSPGRIRLSTDGGMTWTDWSLSTQITREAGSRWKFASSGSTFFLSGVGPAILKTNDGGKSWSEIKGGFGTVHTLANGDLLWERGRELRLSKDGLATYTSMIMNESTGRLFPVAPGEIYGSSAYAGGLQLLKVLPDMQDVRAHWAERYIVRLAETGLVNGFPDGTYRPDEPVSRAAALTLVINAEEIPRRLVAERPFSDAATHWVTTGGYLGAALQTGILNAGDYPGGLLEPDRPASRAEMARLLVRAAGLEAEVPGAVSPVAFADAGEIAPAYRGYVAVAVKHGLLTGLPGSDGSIFFRPQDFLTRAQAAAVIYRLIAHW